VIYDEREEIEELRREIEARFEEGMKDSNWSQGFENTTKKEWWIRLVMDNERLSRRHAEMYTMMKDSQNNEQALIGEFREANRSSNDRAFFIGALTLVLGFVLALLFEN
jgi:hypothetical protein